MSNQIRTLVLCTLMVPVFAGCLIQSTIDAKGAATVNVKYRVGKNVTLEVEKKRMESPFVTVLSASVDEKSFASFDLKADDFTKLSTAKFFEDATITLTDGEAGAKVLSANIVRKNPSKLPDEALEYFGKDFEVSVTLPGEVVSSDATKTSGNTVTWSYGLNEFMSSKKTSMTVTYKNPAEAKQGS